MVREYGKEPEDPKKNAPIIDKPSQELPAAADVVKFHTNADTDVRVEAIHHTLGSSPHQSAAGSHTHNGQDSPLLLEGMVLTGVKGTAAFDSSVAQLLVRLGVLDNSS